MKFFALIIFVSLVEYHNVFSQVVFPTSKPNTCRTSSGEIGRCHKGFTCPEPSTGKKTFCYKMFLSFSVCCPLKSEPIRTGKIVTAPSSAPSCGQRGKIPITFGLSSVSRLTKRSPRRLVERPLKIDDQVAVVGGIPSFRNSWPWMVLLGKRRGPSNIYFCSGVLLNKNYVITAAHCVLEPDPFFARFGEHDYKTPSSTVPEDIEVKDVIFHPKYKVNRGYYDMALLKLTKPISIRKEVKPVCLPWGTLLNEDLIKKKVTVTGWGSEEFGGRPSRVLREVVLEVFEPKVCEESYSKLPDFVADYPEGMNKTTIVCAGDKSGGKDTCQGDSGGPMVEEGRNGIYNLVGIVSKGYGCGLKDFPGIYTPLRNYETLLWIKNTAF
ncbi:UNVERIFIED_CONTAM: hypothetical protein RMT77_008936 [Armadillidium vulgare]